MAYGDQFVLTLFTNSPLLARRADEAGINRVGVDLERLGKEERQKGSGSWISDHQEADLAGLRAELRQAQLFARTNPPHSGLGDEIERLLAAGVEVLMLPMFHSVHDASAFVDLIDGRATVSLLVETAEAADEIDQLARLPGVDEIHIGLNDLHRSLGMGSHFELLTSPLLAQLVECVRTQEVPVGFGGLGRAHDDTLLVPSDLVYAQYPLLGADRALVARAFLNPEPYALDIPAEVMALRQRLTEWAEGPPEAYEAAKASLQMVVMELATRGARRQYVA